MWAVDEQGKIVALGYKEEVIPIIYHRIPEETPFEEALEFLYRCQQRGLDPALGQALLTRRKSKDPVSGREVVRYIPIVTIDGARFAAERTGRYAPGPKTRYEFDVAGLLQAATVGVKVFNAATKTWHTCTEQAFFSEYVQYVWVNSKKEVAAIWARMPRVMLSKVAEMRALRRAFPEILGGFYIEEEWSRVDTEDTLARSSAIKRSQRLTQSVMNKLAPNDEVVDA